MSDEPKVTGFKDSMGGILPPMAIEPADEQGAKGQADVLHTAEAVMNNDGTWAITVTNVNGIIWRGLEFKNRFDYVTRVKEMFPNVVFDKHIFPHAYPERHSDVRDYLNDNLTGKVEFYDYIAETVEHQAVSTPNLDAANIPERTPGQVWSHITWDADRQCFEAMIDGRLPGPTRILFNDLYEYTAMLLHHDLKDAIDKHIVPRSALHPKSLKMPFNEGLAVRHIATDVGGKVNFYDWIDDVVVHHAEGTRKMDAVATIRRDHEPSGYDWAVDIQLKCPNSVSPTSWIGRAKFGFNDIRQYARWAKQGPYNIVRHELPSCGTLTLVPPEKDGDPCETIHCLLEGEIAFVGDTSFDDKQEATAVLSKLGPDSSFDWTVHLKISDDHGTPLGS
jgi:hypothetical protein